MSFNPSAKYTKDELVRLARLFGVPLSADGKAKPRERLMSNLTTRAKTARPTGKLETTFVPNGPMKYSLENLRMFAQERGILSTVDGRRKTKEELLTHLIMAAKGMQLPSGAAKKTRKPRVSRPKTQPKPRTSKSSAPAKVNQPKIRDIPRLPDILPPPQRLPSIDASVAGPSKGAVVQMPNGNLMFAEPQSRAEKRKTARANARRAVMSRLP